MRSTTLSREPRSRVADYGVSDPDAEWGSYALLRTWNEARFRTSLRAAERTPARQLNRDGNRAVMLCTTTDPYQVFRHAEPGRSRELTELSLALVARALELIRDESTLRVRIMTRSPLAIRHIELFQTFGDRLLFGMSIPTLRNDLANLYEPHAPAPSARMAALEKVRRAGVPVYVAMAPTYPESDYHDLARTMTALARMEPVTVFHEPINIRADNVARIVAAAPALGIQPQTQVFQNTASWTNYALSAFRDAEQAARHTGLGDRFHPWPDAILGSKNVVAVIRDPAEHRRWLERSWSRVSEWPKIT